MSVKQNTIANYLGQGWTALMGLVFIPVYIRYMGMEAWGLVGFMSMLQAAMSLLDVGMTPTLSREMARFQAGLHSPQSIRDLLRSMEVVYCGIAVLVVGGVWAASPFLATHWLNASHLPASVLTQAITVIGFVLAARMTEQVYRGAIQGLQRQVWMNAALSGLATLRWGGAVGILAWVSPSVEDYFAWHGFVSLLTVIFFSYQTYRWLPKAKRRARFDFAAIHRVRHFAGGMAATAVLALLLTQVDKLILSKLVSLSEFGYYTLAASVAGALGFLISPIANAIFPHLSELVARDDRQAVIESYHQGSQWMAAILTPAALLLVGFAEPLLYVWSGDPDLAARVAPLLTLLALGTYCNGLMNVPYMAQLAHGWAGFAVRVNIVAVAVIVPAILWAVPRFGAIGAAWAWFALNAGYVFLGIHFMHTRILIGEKWCWYRDSVIWPVVPAALATLGLHNVFDVVPQSRTVGVAALASVAVLLTAMVFLSVPVTRAQMQTLYERVKGVGR